MEQEIKIFDTVIYKPAIKMLPANTEGVIVSLWGDGMATVSYPKHIGTNLVTSHSAKLSDLKSIK